MIDLTDGVPGVTGPDPASFEEFWPFYLSQHMHPVTRAVHVAGTLTAWAVGLTGMCASPRAWPRRRRGGRCRHRRCASPRRRWG